MFSKEEIQSVKNVFKHFFQSKVVCDKCYMEVPSDDTVKTSKQSTICMKCYQEHYFHCRVCGFVGKKSNQHGSGLCRGCAPIHARTTTSGVS